MIWNAVHMLSFYFLTFVLYCVFILNHSLCTYIVEASWLSLSLVPFTTFIILLLGNHWVLSVLCNSICSFMESAICVLTSHKSLNRQETAVNSRHYRASPEDFQSVSQLVILLSVLMRASASLALSSLTVAAVLPLRVLSVRSFSQR